MRPESETKAGIVKRKARIERARRLRNTKSSRLFHLLFIIFCENYDKHGSLFTHPHTGFKKKKVLLVYSLYDESLCLSYQLFLSSSNNEQLLTSSL